MNDDKLLLYYFDDGLDPAERREVAAALAKDADLRERYEALRADLDEARAVPDTKAPADLVARLHESVERAARLERQRQPAPRLRPSAFAWGLALAATLVAGIGIGWFWNGADESLPGIEAPVAGTGGGEPNAGAFERGLAVYLQASRRQIAGLPADAADERSRLVAELVRQNRLYEQAATKNGARDLARVLRAFEPVLLRMASDDVDPGDVAALQEQLAFELSVMLTKMGRQDSQQAGPI